LQPIPLEEFGEHVQHMHADRDKFFELEYNVSVIDFRHELTKVIASQRIPTMMS
jgi:hypothetical protein